MGVRRAHTTGRNRARTGMSVAWAGLGLGLGFTALNLWLLALNAGTSGAAGLASTPFELVTAIAYVCIVVIGIAVLRRRRDNLVGWVFLVAGVVLAFAAYASEYATYGVLTDPGSLPATAIVAWAGAWSWWAAACFGLTFGLMLFPDGSLPSPRWRWAACAAVANLLVLAALHALTPGPLDGEYSMVVNPLGIGAASFLPSLRDLSWVLVSANALVAAAALVVRSKAATEERRSQLLWLVVPAVSAAVVAPVWVLTSGDGGGSSPAVKAMVLLVVFGTPLAVASSLAHAATLRRSVERLVLAREEERRRIRRDLHDGLGPTLAGVALQLDVAKGIVRQDPDAAEAILEGLAARAKEAIRDIRRLVDDLRPPVLDQLGLVSAIREGTSYLNRRGDDDLAVVVETAGNVDALPPATEVTAFRIVMEAVTNASRHGNASRCVVRLALDEALEVRVEDDGAGLAPDHVPGVGLKSMQERAAELGGTCAVEPRPGGGTVVLARLPVGEPS